MNTRRTETAPARRASNARAVLIALVCAGCSGGDSATPVLGCEAAHGIEPDCRFRNPEDLAAFGDGLIVSQFAAMDGSRAGDLVYYDLTDWRIETLFPHGDVAPTTEQWGDPACGAPEAARFSPHGIDLETRADGRHALYVVNHGGRESVEVFEVTRAAGGVELAWRGCATGPAEANLNDVVGRADGGFWVTQMYPHGSDLWSMFTGGLLGLDTGFVWEWHSGGVFQKVPGTDVPFANGIEKSSDEATLFVNSYFGDEVRKIDVATGEVLGSVAVDSPDNVTWSNDGQLLVASHTGSMTDLMACQSLESGACGFAFEIVAVDPETMTRMPVLAHRGAPMGGVTVALERDGVLYLGTFAGDRVSRWRWR